MRWANALSTRASLEAAVTEVVDKALATLGQSADLAIVFISDAYSSEYPRLLPLLRERLGTTPVIGCGGSGIVGLSRSGTTQEIEDEPALSLTLAVLPDVHLQPFHLRSEDLPDLDSSPDQWVKVLGVSPDINPHFLMFGDAMSARITDLLQGLDYAYPRAVKVGGLTAGVSALGGSGLFCQGRLFREGVVGMALSGNIAVEAIVAQGCRPIGPLLRVTESDRHVLLQVEAHLDGERWEGAAVNTKVQTALEALHRALDTLNETDRSRAQNALSIGIVRDEFKTTLETGDFLIRNLIGVDPRIGAIAIGDRLRPGQRVRFHLRDADASAEELEMLLLDYQESVGTTIPPAGALIFDCLGRGERFYGQRNFDTKLFRQYLGTTPIGGFFCQGEIGPVGQATFLHGYTAVFALFRPLT